MQNTTSKDPETFFNYPLEWLDLLITKKLNPATGNLYQISNEEAQELLKQISAEEIKLKYLIKSQIFSLNTRHEIQLLVTRYYSSFINLIDNCLSNLKGYNKFTPEQTYKLNVEALNFLQAFCLFIENRFPEYLTPDERIPANHLENSKKDIQRRFAGVLRKSERAEEVKPVMAIINAAIKRLFSTGMLCRPVTFRDVIYLKDLIVRLEAVVWEGKDVKPFMDLAELLFYMNYNSKAYIKLITSYIADHVERCEDKLGTLLLYSKLIKQIQHHPDRKFNPRYYDLRVIMDNWLDEEIFYVEKKMGVSLQPSEPPAKKNVRHKVMCVLSTDQIGLIIRSADESRILVAKSMNEVFRSIVPHLSTPYKEDLSFDSMRSKSYIAEEKDKEVAIETLERMIRKIKGY